MFAVTYLDIVRVHQAPAILACGAVQRIHAIEDHLRLIHQLVVGFLQQIIAYKRANGKGNTNGANGEQHNDAGNQLGAQWNGLHLPANPPMQGHTLRTRLGGVLLRVLRVS